MTGHVADGGCDSQTPMPRTCAPRPLSRVESPGEGQHTRKAEYVSQYNAWIAGMSEAERAQAAALGVDKPMPEDYRSHGIGLDADLAESKELSYQPDIAALIDQEELAAVSKRCVELTHKLKLLPSRTMRSLTARQAYRHAQRKLRNHDET